MQYIVAGSGVNPGGSGGGYSGGGVGPAGPAGPAGSQGIPGGSGAPGAPGAAAGNVTGHKAVPGSNNTNYAVDVQKARQDQLMAAKERAAGNTAGAAALNKEATQRKAAEKDAIGAPTTHTGTASKTASTHTATKPQPKTTPATKTKAHTPAKR